jgi:hypothetical protein
MTSTASQRKTTLPAPQGRVLLESLSPAELQDLFRLAAATRPAHEAARAAFEARLPEIRQQYAGEWILFYDGAVQAHSREFDDLMAIADAVDPNKAAITRFMQRQPHLRVM